MHVVYSLQPGGMEHGVVKLVNGLDRHCISSAICSTTPGGTLKEKVAPDIPVFELQRRTGNDPRLVLDLYRLFARERPHIVHTHAWGTLVEGLVAARLARIPLVIHGEHGTLQVKRRQRWVQRLGWSAVDEVLSVSSRLAERIERETGFSQQKIRTIRNGVDLSRFGLVSRMAARTSLGLEADALIAITMGRLVPVKDHETLLRAMARVRAAGTPVNLLIAGDGPLKDQLTECATALGVRDRVTFLGYRPDAETVLAAADLFVLSSESEGLSNTILEAMASGLPVVATQVGGADELVVDGVTGRLVPAKSPGELADAMQSILVQPELRRAMAAAGRARAESEFSLEVMLERYRTMYCEVAARKLKTSVAGARESEVV